MKTNFYCKRLIATTERNIYIPWCPRTIKIDVFIFQHKNILLKENIWSWNLKLEADLSWIWTRDHWISFRRSNGLSYQPMSSTHTQSKLYTATPISSFVQGHISFWLYKYLENGTARLFLSFSENKMKGNTDKCH